MDEKKKDEISGYVATMLEQLQSDDTKSVKNALFVLARERSLPDHAYERFSQLLKNSDEDIRYSALFMLLQAPALEEFIKLEVCKFINEKNVDVQRAVARFMIDYMPEMDLKIQRRVCKAIVDSQDDKVRFLAVAALVQWTPFLPEAVEIFSNLIKNGETDEKRLAITAFSNSPELVTGQIVDELFGLLKNDSSAAIRMLSATALSGAKTQSQEIDSYVTAFMADEKNVKAYLEEFELET